MTKDEAKLKEKERRRRAWEREHPKPEQAAEEDPFEAIEATIKRASPIRSRIWRGNRKYGTVAAGIAAVVVAFVLVNGGVGPAGVQPHAVGTPTEDFIGGTLIQGPLFYQPTLNSCTGDYRPDYGLPCADQKALFGNLSFFKADTYDIANATYQSFIHGGSYDIASAGPAYWNQPEFFPGWNAQWPAKFLMQSGYGTPRGYGVYPWTHGWEVCAGTSTTDVSITLTMTDLLATAWNVSYWQAFGLYAFFPAAAMNLNGTVHFEQNTTYAAQHVFPRLDLPGYGRNGNASLYANLTDPSSADYNASVLPTTFPGNALVGTEHNIVLEPVNNPVLRGFRPGWVVPLRMTISIEGAKVGDNFVVDLRTVNWDSTMSGEGSPYFYKYGLFFLTDGDTYGSAINQYVVQVRSC